MNYASFMERLTPVRHALEQVCARFDMLGLSINAAVLVQHARSEVRHMSRIDSYTPSFFEMHLRPKGNSKRLAAAAAGLRTKIDLLERAAAFCAAALLPVEKPLLDLLRRAQICCQRFDDALHAEGLQRERVRRAQHLGGTNRHMKAATARSEAARLLRELAPAAGWKEPREAVRAIIEDLILFVMRERLPLVVGEYFELTVIRWIHKDPEVSAAFRHVP